VFQVRIFPAALQAEIRIVGEQLVTGGDKDSFLVKGNASQATVGAAATPIDVHGVPVDDLADFLIDKVNQEYATMAFTLLTPPDYRGSDKLGHSLP
jgi:hypothetical protein